MSEFETTPTPPNRSPYVSSNNIILTNDGDGDHDGNNSIRINITDDNNSDSEPKLENYIVSTNSVRKNSTPPPPIELRTKSQFMRQQQHHDNYSRDDTDSKFNVSNFWEANSNSSDDDVDTVYIPDETNIHFGNGNDVLHMVPPEPSKISFLKLKKSINHNFDMNLIFKYSSALDILSSYVKCHIHIYSEASFYCSFILNIIMLPCIFISSSCSVLSAYATNYKEIVILVSILNGIVAFLLAIVNYLKLDACSEAHKISAYQYAKLKSYIEFNSGEILLFQDPILNPNFIDKKIENWIKIHKYDYNNKHDFNLGKQKKLQEYYDSKRDKEIKLIQMIQTKITEYNKSLKSIHENNKFILPKHIQRRYANIYNVNIFSYIKNIDAHKLTLINNLRNTKNELNFYSQKSKTTIVDEETKIKIMELYKTKNHILEELFELNNGYSLIDAMFQQELINIDLYRKYWMLFYLQNFIDMCCTNSGIRLIPRNYKHSNKIGYKDQNGVYLLEKILNR